jgi:hypothetical protein
MKLWDKISHLISDEKGAAEEQPHAQPKPTSSQQSEGGQAPSGVDLGGAAALSPAEANTVLSMLPKGQALDQFSAGQIQLLNIESVRSDLGDRWPKYEHQVHLLVEATLRRMLGESDIFTQISDYEYLVIFPNLAEQKASALMYVAAAQIRQKLFGHDPAFAAIRLTATVTRVTRDLMENAPNPVGAIHEATLLGQPAEPPAEEPEEHPLAPGMVPWTDKYKIVPIVGGGMTQGRMVADAMRAGSPMPDFSSIGDGSQIAGGDASGPAASEGGSDPEQAPPVEGYPVVAISGGAKTKRPLVTDPQRPPSRLPDFSTVYAQPPARPGGAGMSGTGAEQAQNPGADHPAEIGGYAVVPITGGGMSESRMVLGTPRVPGRIPDFASPKAAPTPITQPAPSATGSGSSSAAAAGARPPALAARLDALGAKAAPTRAILIGRPTDAQAPGSVGSESTAGAAASPSGVQLPAVEIDELQLLYEPIWDVRRQAVTAYRMKITLKVEGALLGLNEFCVTYDDPKVQSTLNSVILRKLISQIQTMRGENKKAIIVAPIGRRFIEDQSSLRFLMDQLSMLNDQERPLVILEIGDAYFGSWLTLAPRVAMIRRVCRNISIRLSLDHKDFQQVAATGASMAAGDLSDHDWPERQSLAALNLFAAAASKASLRSFIGGLTTSSTVIAAVCAGFNHLSGSAIGEGTPVPLGVYPLSTEGFYLHHQAQRVQQDHGNHNS